MSILLTINVPGAILCACARETVSQQGLFLLPNKILHVNIIQIKLRIKIFIAPNLNISASKKYGRPDSCKE